MMPSGHGAAIDAAVSACFPRDFHARGGVEIRRNSSATSSPIFAKLQGGLFVTASNRDVMAREHHFEKTGYTLPRLLPKV
jgi:hypothetical protein